MRSLVDNVGLTLVARLAMIATPVAAGVFSWLMTNYLDLRFAEARTAYENVLERVVGVESTFQRTLESITLVDRRVTVLETNTARGRAEREQFQERMLSELRDMRVAQGNLAVQMASIASRLEALFEREKQAAQR